MSALPNSYDELPSPLPGPSPTGTGNTQALLLAFPRLGLNGRKLINEASGDRLGPARGLLLGLFTGMVLWIALLAAAFRLLG